MVQLDRQWSREQFFSASPKIRYSNTNEWNGCRRIYVSIGRLGGRATYVLPRLAGWLAKADTLLLDALPSVRPLMCRISALPDRGRPNGQTTERESVVRVQWGIPWP